MSETEAEGFVPNEFDKAIGEVTLVFHQMLPQILGCDRIVKMLQDRNHPITRELAAGILAGMTAALADEIAGAITDPEHAQAVASVRGLAQDGYGRFVREMMMPEFKPTTFDTLH